MAALPLICEPEQLQAHSKKTNLLLLDVSQPATFIQQHIPGAYYFEYNWMVQTIQPVMGLLPSVDQLNRVFSAFGLSPDTHVVAYDDEGGGRACRLLWTLDSLGQQNYSLLNGGLPAWLHSQLPVSNNIQWPTPGHYQGNYTKAPVADRNYILEHLNDDQVIILDCRSSMEYNGTKVFAQRGGHIPGAINIDWIEAVDKTNSLKLKPRDKLEHMLRQRGITPDKTIVTHCQSHHRSSHTYIMLRSLGYEKVKGYPGSWSDWGNATDTPIEV